ncbi:hypothetical protein [Paraburkholderia rhynchosiae]|uniref:Uncharacterized protein n=1 Tax=Paraburkholderia rhynchosiae TaxID=487049 RepID=A0A2N7W9E9_9BURK|nr:hypothetical protein [Paraburkholderia rhynchosiae]PMS26024.1 hypothetical protein C0Z16_28225 [Paraburkholderia rhynchosiae]CAB3731305.1 hypothetical protein LMG27174_05825 [Paraburkholderia rhynchosiae]
MKKTVLSLFLSLYALVSFGTTLSPVQLLNPAGSTSGQVVLSNGPVTAPGWGNVGATSLAAQAANTVVANATASSASPTAFAMPSCSTSASALDWTSGTGFTCNTSINAATLGGSTFASPGAIGSGTPGSGSFTTVVSSGAANFNSLTAGATSITGALTVSQTNGIVGTTTNNNANAGAIGEYVPASATSVAITTAVSTNITSISLTAGDWDVSGVMQVSPAGGTIVGGESVSISTTSATLGGLGSTTFIGATKATGQADIVPTPVVRISIPSTTTVYLVGNVSYTTSTLTVSGLIRARRVR